MKYCLDVKYYSENGEIKPIGSFPAYIAERSGLVYEVIRISDSKPLFLWDHLNRLNTSLNIQNFDSIDISVIERSVQVLINRNSFKDGNIKIVVVFSQKRPKVFIYAIPFRYPTESQIREGVATMLQFDSREAPMAKISNWKVRGNANSIIDSNNIYETILVNSYGEITEGSRSNIFFIKDNKLFTAKNKDVLLGITRSKVIEIAKELNIEIEFVKINHKKIQMFDACFLTGTSSGILQIKNIDRIFFQINNVVYGKIKEYYEKMAELR
jgi:branched-chain amino acid aminotransferase